MQTALSDNEIIELVVKGNKGAYAHIVQRYQSFVYTIVLRYIKSREDAEEVAQDVFIKAYKALADFKGNSKFSTWLYTVTITTCFTFLRKKKINFQSLDDEKVFAFTNTIDAGMNANSIEKKSRIEMVNNAIKLLGTEDAQIITLFYKGEQTIEEIAIILGKEQNAVKVQLHRARTKLKEKMQTYFKQEVNDLF